MGFNRREQKSIMRKALVAIVILLGIISWWALSQTTTAKLAGAFEPTPKAVPGSELNHNVATPKPGYEFINRTNSVDVVRVRTNQIMGTYVCPCTRADKTGTCELVFNPQGLTCKGGSCSGETCLLTAALRTMRQ
jgi:hypothetical protein